MSPVSGLPDNCRTHVRRVIHGLRDAFVPRRALFAVLFAAGFLFSPCLNAARAETAIVHAKVVWEMTDVVVQENMSLCWNVDKDSLWCFNAQLFPEWHNADGIPVEALNNYVCPGQPIGKLIGRIGDNGRPFPMGTSGSINIMSSEGGDFLYLSMNDDIMGIYGNGFKDNEGELTVTLTQTRHKAGE